MRPHRRLLLAITLALGTACASAGGPEVPTPTRGDSRTVTADELAAAIHLNLFDYLSAERPRWLRNPTAVGAAALPVLVYMDDTRLGGAQTLKTLTTSTVRMVRYFDASAAQQRFSGRDVGPVIQVILK